jgi:hypothetical protein
VETTKAAKLEGHFRLNLERPGSHDGDGHSLENDRILIPERWKKDRAKGETAEKFGNARMSKGVNRWSRFTMRLLCAMNLLTAFLALCIARSVATS